MKVNNTLKILIGLIIVLGISLIYGTAELIFKNTTSNSPSVDNNKTVVMDNPIEENIVSNNNIEENKDKPIEDKNKTGNPITNNNKTENNNKVEKNEVKNNEEINQIDNIDTKDKETDKNNNGKNNSKNNNKKNNSKNNDNKNKKGNSNNDKPILENNVISEEKALEIGFKKVGSGGKLENINAYLDDNPPKYKIEIIKNKQKYRFEIHARTGAILEYEKEKMKNK